MWSRILSLGLFSLVLLTNASAWSSTPPTPAGPVILTVSGQIERRNAGDLAQFDHAMLESLGVREFETGTPFTDGPHRWRGVPIDAFLEAVGATGDTLRVTAINDYSVDVAIETLREMRASLVLYRDGERMSRRDKGPIWLLFPFDELDDNAIAQGKIFAVWSVRDIEVK